MYEITQDGQNHFRLHPGEFNALGLRRYTYQLGEALYLSKLTLKAITPALERLFDDFSERYEYFEGDMLETLKSFDEEKSDVDRLLDMREFLQPYVEDA